MAAEDVKEPLLGRPTQVQVSVPVAAHEQGEAAGSVAPRPTYAEIIGPFSVLGWTAFGGPTAHIARYHNSFVENRMWLSEELFAELLALCQMLPGPSSSQMSFSLGILRKGPLGGVVSGVLFLYPGLLLLTLAGLGAAKILVDPPKWLQAATGGLVAVAVALVADAAVNLGHRICKVRVTQLICCASSVLAFAFPTQWLFPAVIVGGGVVMALASKWGLQVSASGGSSQQLAGGGSRESSDAITHLGISPLAGYVLLGLWLSILVAAVLAKRLVPYEAAPWVHWFQAMYLTGSVAYGGGQVMLPFLQNVVVQYDTVCPPPSASTLLSPWPLPPGFTAAQPCRQVESNSTWVTERQFLTGLGLVQAMPGPLFNFSAYLGAVMGGLVGALVCWLGCFAPGLMLLYAALPFWTKFRSWALYKKALPGLNAAAVGLIYATVFQLGLSTYQGSPFPVASVSIGMAGFGASAFLKVPAPLTVLLGALCGIVVWLLGGL